MSAAEAPARAIRIAVLAMGGEGGGVLADWIVDLAEHGGYIAQATSVPGVAQRTGATIYYIEIFPKAAAERAGRAPVLALMPVPGDVDVVIASELMEAARAVQRGLVTPDRTVLVASTNRVHAMTEKIALADGRSDSAALLASCRHAAKALFAADLAQVAESNGSVVSAALFGGLAASGALPFEPAAFAATIGRAGVGIAASQRAFAAAIEAVARPSSDMPSDSPRIVPRRRRKATITVDSFPLDLAADARAVVEVGLTRLADYQDAAYASLYRERLLPIATIELARAGGTQKLLTETARYLALGMAFEDTIRVAELKTRARRFARVRDEIGATDGQIVEIAEFMHPRLQEIAETVPAPLGRFLMRNIAARRVLNFLTRKGRIVKTTSIPGFLLLTAVASLKRWRRSSLRYAAEQRSLEDWLGRIVALAPDYYDLAVEVAESRTLVKGYGDTHARGTASYEAILAALPRLRDTGEAAAKIAALRQAALADDTGMALAKALAALDGTAA